MVDASKSDDDRPCRVELGGEDAITFLTSDGFTITVEGTIEYALMRDRGFPVAK